MVFLTIHSQFPVALITGLFFPLGFPQMALNNFLFFHFILLHTRVLYAPYFISFSPPELPATSHLLFFVPQKKNFALLIREKRVTETERKEKDWERSTWASTACISTVTLASLPPGWVRSTFFFFFFSYLIVLIQIYFKN